MPEVFREGSIIVRVLLPPREHGPAHVHVTCPDGVVIIELFPTVVLREIHGRVKPSVMREVLELIESRRDECFAAWREYHD